jgi:hypothetical protein
MQLRAATIDELVTMSPAERQARTQLVELGLRRLFAESALQVQYVDDSCIYLADGHKRVAAWAQANHNWSNAYASDMVKLAHAMKWLPQFAASCLAGLLAIPQMLAVAKVAANPRVREHLAEADELFTTAARDLPFHDFSVLLRHWEELADADGARARHDRAILERRAGVSFVGARSYLDAQGTSYDGVLFAEVLQHYTDLEFQTEWDVLAKIHGDAMCAGLMERTHSQRAYDALQRIFALAAGSEEAGPDITVNIEVDLATFEHGVEAAAGGDPEPIPPSQAPNRRCEDSNGRVVDPRAVVAAALAGQVRRKVIGADGVVLDMGRRQRLFTGPLRDAVLGASRRCTYAGCRVPGPHCEADHLVPYSERGPTNARNGGPGCNHHNRWKNKGFRTFRDAKGLWHTFRPDGTEIGWPTIYANLEHLEGALLAHAP